MTGGRSFHIIAPLDLMLLFCVRMTPPVPVLDTSKLLSGIETAMLRSRSRLETTDRSPRRTRNTDAADWTLTVSQTLMILRRRL